MSDGRSDRGARTSAAGTADPPLGGLSASSFLRRCWQKDALLVRGAIARFTGPFDARQLFTFARRDDIESRLIVREGARWSLEHGPFRPSDFTALPARNWTLLIQGVNLVSAAGDALLRRFAFMPYARLDDLMVSHVAPGVAWVPRLIRCSRQGLAVAAGAGPAGRAMRPDRRQDCAASSRPLDPPGATASAELRARRCGADARDP
jgi:hypothetical protein